MQLIGITGFKTSGKDTTYSMVRDLHEGTVQRAAFADKLKIMAALALGFKRPDDELIELMNSVKEASSISVFYEEQGAVRGPYDDNALVHHLTGRQYLQNFGAHARRVFGDSFWVDQVLPQPLSTQWAASGNASALKQRFSGADCVCVTDARYPNEAERVRALGGVVWEVVRPGLESDGHSSEIPLDRHLVDYVIVNDGGLDSLEWAVQRAMESL